MATVTFGLAQILVGEASAAGTMPASPTKIGQVFKDTCKIAQETAEKNEFFEEGQSAPFVVTKSKKMPKITFSIATPDVQTLIDYVGGTNIGTTEAPKWGYTGSEVVANKAVRIDTEQGLTVDIPNCDIEAVINGEFSKKGLFMVDFTLTPLAVTSGAPISAYSA